EREHERGPEEERGGASPGRGRSGILRRRGRSASVFSVFRVVGNRCPPSDLAKEETVQNGKPLVPVKIRLHEPERRRNRGGQGVAVLRREAEADELALPADG